MGNVSLSGMVSGLDTEAIIEQLVKAYSTKKTNVEKAKTKHEWKQEAWKDTNSKIYGFYSGKLSTMRFSKAFNVKKATSSSTKATVSASSGAVTSTQKLKVNKLATSGYLTGGVVKKADSSDTSKITGSTKLSELGIGDGSSFTITTSGKTTDISIDENTTVNQLVSKMKSAGVNASFDENNQRFFVSSTASGKDGDFSITANNSNGNTALSALGLNAATSADVDKYRSQAALTDDEVNSLIETAYAKKKTALYDISDDAAMSKVKESLQSQLDKAKANIKTNEEANDKISKRLEAAEEVKDMSIDDRKSLVTSTEERIKELSEKKEEDRTDDEKEELNSLTQKLETYKESVKTTYDLEKYVNDLNDKKTSNDENIALANEIVTKNEAALASDEGFTSYIEGKNTEITAKNEELHNSLQTFYTEQRDNAKKYVDAYDLVNSEGVDKNSQAYKDAIAVVGDNASGGTGAVRIAGQDAEIELNGATFTSNTNNFQINGLTISANTVTDPGEEITITTDTDIDGIYDMIKDFFKEYNELIIGLDKSYNAASAKGYEPLTDEEKDEMSEKEVEKWETKIKDALLRGDQTLNSVMNSMTSTMMKTYNINGKNYSLSTFGITTTGYINASENNQYAYHIDGDKDDSTSSGNADKLKAAIAADPEGITAFFTKLATDVYDQLSNKMRSTSLSSAYTVYNDKQMTKDQKEYKTKLSDWEDKIDAYETRYRKQFTAMEKALATLNSNTSSLTSMLG